VFVLNFAVSVNTKIRVVPLLIKYFSFTIYKVKFSFPNIYIWRECFRAISGSVTAKILQFKLKNTLTLLEINISYRVISSYILLTLIDIHKLLTTRKHICF